MYLLKIAYMYPIDQTLKHTLALQNHYFINFLPHSKLFNFKITKYFFSPIRTFGRYVFFPNDGSVISF